jgi:hypothetical protein
MEQVKNTSFKTHRNLLFHISKALDRFTRIYEGHAIAQVVSHQLLTMEAGFATRGNACGICVGQSCTGTGSSVGLSLFPINIASVLHIHLYIIWGMESGAISGCSSTETWCCPFITIIIRFLKMSYGHRRRAWIQGLHIKSSSFPKNLHFYQLLLKAYCSHFSLLARDLSQALNIRGKPVGPC